jgi:hypothetical protein
MSCWYTGLLWQPTEWRTAHVSMMTDYALI